MSAPAAEPRRPSVLVTGSAGYLGRLTVAALAAIRDELDAVVALDVAEVAEDKRLPGVAYAQKSVCDEGLEDILRAHAIDTVVHLAAIVRPPAQGGVELAYKVDVEGTRNVLEACVKASVKKLIVTTSGAAYGYHRDNRPWLREDDPLRGNDDLPYSRHKRLVEEMLARYRGEHPELAQLVFRPGTIVGDTVKSPVTDLFERPFVLGVAGSSSPFVFIWDQDVVACILRGVLGPETGIYNLAGDGALTPREIARRLRKPYLPIPAPLLQTALRALRRLGKTPFGPEQVNFLRYRPVLSNTRLKRDFGYTPRLTSSEAFELYRKAHAERR
jgi:UDP-glucose 4-epimerase